MANNLPPIHYEAEHLFESLAKTRLTPLNRQRWFYDLDRALVLGGVGLVLFLRPCGIRVKRPDNDKAEIAHYEEANFTAARWIALAAGSAHRHTTDPFLESGDGVGMYDALVSQCSKPDPITRHHAIEALLVAWMNPLPAVGTNWAAEFTALYYNNRAMKTASKGMSIDEFIDEIHLYALMHRTERTSMFHKELWFGIRGQEHKWDTVEDKLLHLMGVEEMLNANKQSSIQHSKPTNRPPVSYHPAPLPPSTSISHPFPPPYDTSFLRDDGQANVSRAVSRGFYSESHYMSECNSFEMPDCNDSINNFQTFARSGNNYNHGGGLRSGSRGRGGRSKV